MKKIIVMIFLVVMCLCFSACDLLDNCARNGHSTKLGDCSKCGEFINEYESTINSITSDVTKSVTALKNAGNVLIYNSSSISDSDINESKEYINTSKQYLNIAINSCGDILELQTLRSYLYDMRNSLDKITGTRQTYIDNYSQHAKTYTLYLEHVNEELIDWLGSSIAKNLQ